MNNIPKPASPLPWRACDDQTDTYPHVADVNGDPVTEFNGCEWGDFEDCCYIAWAANNAQALYEALVATLDKYISLAESGDAGFWDPNTEDHVMRSRAALKAARGEA